MKNKKIGVICAMESEAALIRSSLEHPSDETVGSLTFTLGNLGETEVILCVCGIGKVFAALCAQTMILRFAPDGIINSGVAGSLTDRLEILDLAVGESLVQHDMDTSPLGDPVGLISGINRVKLPTDKALNDAILSAAKKLGFRTLSGTIASGDQFIAEKEQKERIKALFDPIACEMEGAAIAQVAYINKIPFACIRAISDSFSGKNEMDYALFAPAAADRGATLLIEAIKNRG